jgi:hypothetical protein
LDGFHWLAQRKITATDVARCQEEEKKAQHQHYYMTAFRDAAQINKEKLRYKMNLPFRRLLILGICFAMGGPVTQ